MSDNLDPMLGLEFEKIEPDDTPFDAAGKGYRNSILCLQYGASILRARIAELEATVARLTAPVTEDEARLLVATWTEHPAGFTTTGHVAALTAFLERRMRG